MAALTVKAHTPISISAATETARVLSQSNMAPIANALLQAQRQRRGLQRRLCGQCVVDRRLSRRARLHCQRARRGHHRSARIIHRCRHSDGPAARTDARSRSPTTSRSHHVQPFPRRCPVCARRPTARVSWVVGADGGVPVPSAMRPISVLSPVTTSWSRPNVVGIEAELGRQGILPLRLRWRRLRFRRCRDRSCTGEFLSRSSRPLTSSGTARSGRRELPVSTGAAKATN